jgi:hypothetical protein
MRERDSLSRLLARHGAGGGDHSDAGGRHQSPRGSARLLDDEAKARILDASLGVLAALRALADVTEDVLRERRDSLLGDGGSRRSSSAASRRSNPADVRDADAPGAEAREQIPLTY